MFNMVSLGRKENSSLLIKGCLYCGWNFYVSTLSWTNRHI